MWTAQNTGTGQPAPAPEPQLPRAMPREPQRGREGAERPWAPPLQARIWDTCRTDTGQTQDRHRTQGRHRQTGHGAGDRIHNRHKDREQQPQTGKHTPIHPHTPTPTPTNTHTPHLSLSPSPRGLHGAPSLPSPVPSLPQGPRHLQATPHPCRLSPPRQGLARGTSAASRPALAQEWTVVSGLLWSQPVSSGAPCP